MSIAVTLKGGVDSFSQIAIEYGSKVAATSAKVVNTTARMCTSVEGATNPTGVGVYPVVTFFKYAPSLLGLLRGYSTLASRNVTETFVKVDGFLNAICIPKSIHAVASGAVKNDWNNGKKASVAATISFGVVNTCSTLSWLDDMKLVNLEKIADRVGKGCFSFVKKIALDTTLFAFLVAGLLAALVDTAKNCANQEDRTALKLKVAQLVSDTVRYSIHLFRLPLQPVTVTLGTLSGAMGIVASFRREYK